MLLYELLTGTTPFDARDAEEGGIRRDAADHPRGGAAEAEHAAQHAGRRRCRPSRRTRGADPRQLEPVLRGELDWIVMKALEKDRNRRYETANAFAADVQRYLNDEPVEACPPSAGYRLRKFSRRNRRSCDRGGNRGDTGRRHGGQHVAGGGGPEAQHQAEADRKQAEADRKQAQLQGRRHAEADGDRRGGHRPSR